MAFIKKLWKDRISQFPNRRTINDGSVTKQVTVGRDEGTITEPGDSFDASNMNDLEQRIEDAYGDVVSLVASEVAAQYDQENVIFDPVATEGHGVGFVVSSDYIANLKAGDLKDVNITTPTPGEALVFDADGNLVNGTVSTVGGLNDLNDVAIDETSLSDKQELLFNEDEGVFENKTTRVELTQAEYDQLVADNDVLPDVDYYITDAPSIQGSAKDLSYDGTPLSTYDKIEEVASDVDTKADKTISSGSGQAGTSVSLIRLTVKEFNNVKFISGALQVTAAVNAGHLLCTIDNGFGRVDTNTWDIVGSSPSGAGVALYITNKVELRANTNLSANAVVVFNSWYI